MSATASSVSPRVAIRSHSMDNAVTARRLIQSGAQVDDSGVRATEDVPAGHKVALRAIARGEPVLKAGNPIGVASVDIPAGARLHGGLLMPIAPESRPITTTSRAAASHTFEGFVREDGRVGTRNFIGVMIASNCGATAARQAAEWFTEERLADFPNVDGVIPLIHSMGCGMEMTGEPMDLLRRTLSGVIRNPNMAGAVVVALGCERNNLKVFMDTEGLSVGDRLQTVTLQDVGGTRAAIETAIAHVQAMLPRANAASRSTVPASSLTLGLQTGAADAFCGISANPALGVAVDMLIAEGGTVILSETPDLVMSGDVFAARAVDADVAASLSERMQWWQSYAGGRDTRLDGKLDRGGDRGGFATGLERALDGLSKAGTAPLAAVRHYAERANVPGLVLMDSPDHDLVSVTGQTASGATMIAMTTGIGTAFGSLPAPTVKISSNTETFQRMHDAIDVDAGPVLDGAETVEEAGNRIFEVILRHASGEQTKGEIEGMGETGFSPWSIGVCS